MREITPVEFAALKTASRALVQEVGGIEAAAMACRYQKSAIAEACSRSAPDRTLPLDVVADLERCAGQPFVTRVLAGLSGHALVPVAGDGARELPAVLAVLARNAALAEGAATAAADGGFSGGERQALKDQLLVAIEAAQRAIAALDAASQPEGA